MTFKWFICYVPNRISTHTSRVGCDWYQEMISWHIQKFLLTHPVWDVTHRGRRRSLEIRFLLTHPVWDVTLTLAVLSFSPSNFYSHIPCGMWREKKEKIIQWTRISTHTSRVGCDGLEPLQGTTRYNFYSHIPCGMWRKLHINAPAYINFYSHIPCGMWRSTLQGYRERRLFLLTHPVWDVTQSEKRLEKH